MSEPEPSRPGSILRAEREALGVTVREVSETLNLSIAVIEAIEADDHQRLPGPVFARGYVRAYARLLELEPEPLVAQYPPPDNAVPAARAGSESPVWEWIRRRPALVLGGGAIVLVLLLVLLVVWLWPGSGAGTSPAEVADSVPEPTAGIIRDERLPAAAVERLDGDSATEPATPVAQDFVPAVEPQAPAADVSGAAGSAAARTEPADSEVESVRRITATGEDRLQFAFSEDCWVEVRDGSGGNLYSNLSRRGSRLILLGQGPFRILLGYAPGAELSFNGEPVPLGPHTRNNVATLVLGQ